MIIELPGACADEYSRRSLIHRKGDKVEHKLVWFCVRQDVSCLIGVDRELFPNRVCSSWSSFKFLAQLKLSLGRFLRHRSRACKGFIAGKFPIHLLERTPSPSGSVGAHAVETHHPLSSPVLRKLQSLLSTQSQLPTTR
jgi:hypothetical protein